MVKYGTGHCYTHQSGALKVWGLSPFCLSFNYSNEVGEDTLISISVAR